MVVSRELFLWRLYGEDEYKLKWSHGDDKPVVTQRKVQMVALACVSVAFVLCTYVALSDDSGTMLLVLSIGLTVLFLIEFSN